MKLIKLCVHTAKELFDLSFLSKNMEDWHLKKKQSKKKKKKKKKRKRKEKKGDGPSPEEKLMQHLYYCEMVMVVRNRHSDQSSKS